MIAELQLAIQEKEEELLAIQSRMDDATRRITEFEYAPESRRLASKEYVTQRDKLYGDCEEIKGQWHKVSAELTGLRVEYQRFLRMESNY